MTDLDLVEDLLENSISEMRMAAHLLAKNKKKVPDRIKKLIDQIFSMGWEVWTPANCAKFKGKK